VVVRDGKAVEKVITTGRHGSDWAEVVSGLEAGEIVVLSPGSLRTGQRVSARNGAERNPRVPEANREQKPASK
jgi:hypothetical protein